MTQQDLARRIPELNAVWEHIVVDGWSDYRGYRLTGKACVLSASKPWPTGLIVCRMDNSPLHPDDTMYAEQELNLIEEIEESPLAIAKYLEVCALNTVAHLHQLIDAAYADPTTVPRPFSGMLREAE